MLKPAKVPTPSWLLPASPWAGHVSVATANAFFGAWSVGARMAAGTVDPIAFSAVRCVLTGILGAGLTWRVVPQACHEPRLAMVGVVACAIQVFFILGATWTDAHTCAALQAVSPVFGFSFPVLLGLESPSRAKVASAFVAVSGVVMLTGAQLTAAGHPEYRLGVAALLMEQVMIALLPIVQRPLVRAYDPVSLTSLGLIYTGYAMSTVMAVYGAMLYGGVEPLHGGDGAEAIIATLRWCFGPGLGVLFFVVVLLTMFAQTLRTFANARLPVSTVVLYSATQPVWGTVLAVAMLREPLTATELAGTAAIVAALALAALDDDAAGEREPLQRPATCSPSA